MHYRPSHCGNTAIGMGGDTRSPRLARSRRPEDAAKTFQDEESNEVLS